MREQYGKQVDVGYGKLYRLSGSQADMIIRVLYDRVVKLQDDEKVCNGRKEILRLRTEQRFVRRIIAKLENSIADRSVRPIVNCKRLI